MGLDTSHDCWHGAYSAFNRWREAVAKAAGIPLPLMAGFWGGYPGEDDLQATIQRNLPRDSAWRKDPNGSMVATRDTLVSAMNERMALGDAGSLAGVLARVSEWLPLRWEALAPDPLHTLLHHSDCDGEIASAECGPIAERLESLLPEIGKGEDPWGHIGDWQAKTRKFIDGLRLAASRGENVEFA